MRTPGPWNFYDDSNDGKTNRIEIVATGKTIARIYHSVSEEDLPNARLIAAAPELLEALTRVMSWIDNWSPSFTDDDEWPADRDAAEVAIAKALGEQA